MAACLREQFEMTVQARIMAALFAGIVVIGLSSGALAATDSYRGGHESLTRAQAVEDLAVHDQQVLDDILAEALKTPDPSGYAGSTINIDALTLTILWTDPVPADVQKLAGTDPASGARVSVIVVRYSEVDITAAGRRVFASIDAEGLVRPNVIGATSDRSGLRIEVKPADLEKAQSQSKSFEELAGMSVEIVAGAEQAPRPLGG